MQQIRMTVGQLNGLHARPAARFVQTAASFKSSVLVEANGKQANGKSILQVLSLAAVSGVELLITVEGPDECECAASIRDLLQMES